jgi:transposase-like protein
MSESKRKIFTVAQKAKVTVEAIKGLQTVNQIAKEYGVHPTQVSLWKKEGGFNFEVQHHVNLLFMCSIIYFRRWYNIRN